MWYKTRKIIDGKFIQYVAKCKRCGQFLSVSNVRDSCYTPRPRLTNMKEVFLNPYTGIRQHVCVRCQDDLV